MRKLSEFIVWNHVFVLFEVWRSFWAKEYILCGLGGGTFVLSTLRHLFHERIFNTIEPLFAKSAEFYITAASWYYFRSRKDIIVLMLSKLLIYTVWKYQYYNYEKIHPWLHILIAIDAHYYINVVRASR